MVAAVLVTSTLAVPAVASGASGPTTTAGEPGASPRSVVVVLEPGSDSSRVATRHARHLGLDPTFVYDEALDGYAATVPVSALDDLRTDPAVAEVLPDRRLRTAPIDPAIAAQATQEPAAAVERVGALESPTASIDGEDERVDIDIAVVDSGVQSDHPDLSVAGGVDCVAGSSDPATWEDVFGHGTMVAGLAGALDNAVGRVGIAPGARIWSVRVADAQGAVLESSLLCGMDWVIAHAQTIEVANLSLGGLATGAPPPESATGCESPSSIEHRIVCASLRAGVTVVAAAGNAGIDAGRFTPARVPAVITVSAMSDTDGEDGGRGPVPECLPDEADDTFASFSNFGPVVDLSAPGVCVGSTYPGGTYAEASGTSFSTALVSGAAGLYLAEHPGATPEEVSAALADTAEPGPVSGDPDSSPEGLLDVSTF
jgi:subtilisin family serine protease